MQILSRHWFQVQDTLFITSEMTVKLKEDHLKRRFEDINNRYSQKELDTQAAADILGISVRTFLRKRNRYEEEGFDGRFVKT